MTHTEFMDRLDTALGDLRLTPVDSFDVALELERRMIAHSFDDALAVVARWEPAPMPEGWT